MIVQLLFWRHVASRICSKEALPEDAACYLAFSPRVSLEFKWCNHIIVLIWLQLGRIPVLVYFGLVLGHINNCRLFYTKSNLIHINNSIQTIQFSISTLFSSIGSYQLLLLWAKEDLGAMAIKGYSAFLKAPALLKPQHQIVNVISKTFVVGGVLPLCRDAVSVFYSPSWLGYYFTLSVRSDFHMIINLSIAIHVLSLQMLILLSVDEILLLRYGNWSTNFIG